jgi:hypothetical protein
LNEAYGFWQIVIVQREELEFFCANKEVAFAANSIRKPDSCGQWQASDPMRAVLPAVHRNEPQNICHSNSLPITELSPSANALRGWIGIRNFRNGKRTE